MIDKVSFDNIDGNAIEVLKTANYNNLMKIAIDYSDALIKGSKELPEELVDYLDQSEKPVLDFHSIEEFVEPYTEFYKNEVLG